MKHRAGNDCQIYGVGWLGSSAASPQSSTGDCAGTGGLGKAAKRARGDVFLQGAWRGRNIEYRARNVECRSTQETNQTGTVRKTRLDGHAVARPATHHGAFCSLSERQWCMTVNFELRSVPQRATARKRERHAPYLLPAPPGGTAATRKPRSGSRYEASFWRPTGLRCDLSS